MWRGAGIGVTFRGRCSIFENYRARMRLHCAHDALHVETHAQQAQMESVNIRKRVRAKNAGLCWCQTQRKAEKTRSPGALVWQEKTHVGCVNGEHDISLRIVSTDLKCCLQGDVLQTFDKMPPTVVACLCGLLRLSWRGVGKETCHNSFPQMSSTVVVCLCGLLQLSWSVVGTEKSST